MTNTNFFSELLLILLAKVLALSCFSQLFFKPSLKFFPISLVITCKLEFLRLGTFPKLFNGRVLLLALVQLFFLIRLSFVKLILAVITVIIICLLVVKYAKHVQIIVLKIILSSSMEKYFSKVRRTEKLNQVSRN